MAYPLLHRNIAAAADPDWSATQVAPTDDLITIEPGTLKLGFVVVAKDGANAIVSGTVDVQPIDVSPTRLSTAANDVGPTSPLVSGGEVTTIDTGILYIIDVANMTKVVLRVDGLAVVGAATLEIYWRVME